MPVNSHHRDYDKYVERWKRCRDVADGQDAVHARGEKYLPKLSQQKPDEYEAYKTRAVFYNATWRTIAGMLGMVFRKEPVVEVPKAVDPLLKDVTQTGVPMTLFLQSVTEDALKIGRIGVLVDYPEVSYPAATTLADARAQNLRPRLCSYPAEAIINWKVALVGNELRLTLVVLEEQVEVNEDDYKVKTETQYRVLDLFNGSYRVRHFKVDDKGKDEQLGPDVTPLMDGKPLTYIPFKFIGADDATPDVDEPPLIDLVNVNLGHYRSTADYEHGCHFTGLPTAWVAGYKKKDGEVLYIGSTEAWVFSQPDAKAGYLEFTGQGLAALEKNLASKEQQMAVLGARLLEPQRKAVEAAQTESIRRKGEESALSTAAIAVSLGMTQLVIWFCAWSGSPDEKAKVELNREFFATPMTPQMLTALVSSWQSGAISDQTLFDNLQRSDVIAHDVTLEEEQAAIQSSTMRLPPELGPPVGDDDLPGGAP